MVNDYIRGSNRNVKKVKKLNFNKFDLLSNFTKNLNFHFQELARRTSTCASLVKIVSHLTTYAMGWPTARITTTNCSAQGNYLEYLHVTCPFCGGGEPLTKVQSDSKSLNGIDPRTRAFLLFFLFSLSGPGAVSLVINNIIYFHYLF